MLQDINEVSTTQYYPLGKRYAMDDRVYRYARAGNTLNCGLGAHIGFTQDVGFCAVTEWTPWTAGKYTLVVTVGEYDGRLGTGAIAANELSGGYIIIFPDGMGDTINRRITANTVVTASGGTMTVTVDKPLTVALTPDPHAELLASPYLDVLEGNKDRQMIMGMPTMAADAEEYLWLQTWGPCWGTPVVGDWATIDSSLAMFRGNGSIAAFNQADPTTGIQQIAGTVMTPAREGGQGAPFVWLQISP